MTTVELTDDNFESTIKDNDIVLVPVFNQAGALPATALAQVVEAVKNLDMREVRTDLATQADKSAPQT